jgi:hypothetical protein
MNLIFLIFLKKAQSFSTDRYLTHYWPITNGTMKDVIGSAHMTPQGNLTSFGEDRFGNLDSALALNGGWTRVPGGIYFNTPEFSISVWFYPMNVSYWARIIDFGNGPSSDNILLTLSNGNSFLPFFHIYDGINWVYSAESFQEVNLSNWQLLTVTYDGKNVRIFLNGQLKANVYKNYTLKSNLNRSNCYIGKSNWLGDGYSYSYLDDLRFYNKSLTQTEILDLMMSQNQTSKT